MWGDLNYKARSNIKERSTKNRNPTQHKCAILTKQSFNSLTMKWRLNQLITGNNL